MNKSEIKQVSILAQMHKMGMAVNVALGLSALIRSARTNKSKQALMEYADIFGVRQHPDFIIWSTRPLRRASTQKVSIMEKISFDFVEGQLVQLFNSRPEDAWDIYDVTNDKLIEALYWNDPNGDFDELPREKLLEIFLVDFVVNRSNWIGVTMQKPDLIVYYASLIGALCLTLIIAIWGWTMTNQQIKDLYDSNPNMTLMELSRISGVSIDDLKWILISGVS